MKFLFAQWDEFCRDLKEMKIQSVRADEVLLQEKNKPFLILKHDVETDVNKALKMAIIEHKYGHRGSYYVQAYLLEKPQNLDKLHKIARLGHEVSYHYDVLDSCKGNIDKAVSEFKKNKSIFEDNGFPIVTVCQHGNPIIERKGYTSNRDFFRNPNVKRLYENIYDIMVDYKAKIDKNYLYFSDAGRHFQMIYDPLFNDVIDSDEKNIPYDDLKELLFKVDVVSNNCIISTHPHRWCNSAIMYAVKAKTFLIIKKIAKGMTKIPFCNRLMSRYYYLAKKI